MNNSIKNDFIKKITYLDHELVYYYKPSIYATEQIDEIYKTLEFINDQSLKLNYGIFDKNNDINQTFSNVILCLMFKDEKPIGFYYDYIVEETIIHFGLVVIIKNPGVDLVSAPRMFSILWLNNIIKKDYYGTFLTAIPKIIEAVSVIFPNAWPTHESLHKINNKEYIYVINSVYKNYVKKFFPLPDQISLDERKFLLTSDAKEMGFERNIKNMPLARNILINLFCSFWIDYEKNQDLFQVVKIDQKTRDQIKILFPEVYSLYEKNI